MPIKLIAKRTTLMQSAKWDDYEKGPSNIVENPEWGEGQFVTEMGEDQVFYYTGNMLHCRSIDSFVGEPIVGKRVVLYVPNKRMKGTGHIQVGEVYEIDAGGAMFVQGGDGLDMEGEIKGVVAGVYQSIGRPTIWSAWGLGEILVPLFFGETE